MPWHRYRGQEDADGDIPESRAEEAEAVKEGPKQYDDKFVVYTRRVPPRAFQIRKEDGEKHGFTRGCAGCSSWFRGLGRQPHSVECRARFAELMKEDAKFKNAEVRKREFNEKMERKRIHKQRKICADTTVEAKIGDAETNDKDIGEGDDGKRELAPEDPGVVLGAASSSGMTDEQRQEKRRSRERRDAGNAEGDEEIQETELKQQKRSADKDVKNQVQGEMDVDAVQSGETSHTFWEDEVDVDTDWKMMQEMEGRSAKEASRIMSDTPEICSFNRNVEEDASEVDVGPGEMAVNGGWAWDDVKNQALDLKKVLEARREEIACMVKRGVWKEVDVKECWEKTSKAPITIKWVDTEKGGAGEVKIRRGLVARDFRLKGARDREDLFAATHPLELLRMLISKTCTATKNGYKRKMLFVDVTKAHLNPLCDQGVYFWLPDEVGPSPGKVASWSIGSVVSGRQRRRGKTIMPGRWKTWVSFVVSGRLWHSSTRNVTWLAQCTETTSRSVARTRTWTGPRA